MRLQQTQHSNSRKIQSCLDHVGQLMRSRKWSTKRGGEHHIATCHGPMVQGGLLMAHPRGVHGDGGAPGGGSSFRQGVGAASTGSPDLETEAAAVQRGDWEKNFDIRAFLVGCNIYAKGGSQGVHLGARRPPSAPYPSAAPPGRLGPWWVPSFPILVIPEGSSALIFYIIFLE